MPSMEIICLANSRKLGGRCIAGLRTDGGGWVRPVAEDEEGTLFLQHFGLQEGSVPHLLDVLQVPLAAPHPRPYQPENWVVGPGQWKLVDRPANQSIHSLLKSHLVTGPELLGGWSDRIPLWRLELEPAKASLALIAPAELRWQIIATPSGKRQTRAVFELKGTSYNLAVTDPRWEARLSHLTAGTYDSESHQQGRILLTVSLGEPYDLDLCCYRLVAAVIQVPKEWEKSHPQTRQSETPGSKKWGRSPPYSRQSEMPGLGE